MMRLCVVDSSDRGINSLDFRVLKAIERRYEALMDKHGSISAEKERLGKENAEMNKVGFCAS